MALTDLTGTTWYFNNSIGDSNSYGIYGDGRFSINFVSNSTNFIVIVPRSGPSFDAVMRYSDGTQANEVYSYSTSTWENEAYRTISITGGDAATNSTLIAWFEGNATQILPTTDQVTIAYNNATIHTATSTSDFTLPCKDKKMATDVTFTVEGNATLTVAYNGSNIIDEAGAGSYVMKCGGCVMSSDVVGSVEVSGGG